MTVHAIIHDCQVKDGVDLSYLTWVGKYLAEKKPDVIVQIGDFLPTINQIFYKVGLCGVVSFDKEMATLCITDTDDGSQIVLTSPMAEANLKGCHRVPSATRLAEDGDAVPEGGGAVVADV